MKRCAERKTSSTNYRKAMNKIFRFIYGIELSLAILVPIIAFAAAPGGGGFDDPLQGVSIVGFITNIINFLLGLVGLLALLSLIVGGIHMVASFGKEDTIARGKKIILWAIAGLVVVSLAWAILNLVVNQFLGAQ